MAVVTLTDPANNGTDVLVKQIKTDDQPNHEHFHIDGTTSFPVVVVPATKKVRVVNFTIGQGFAGAGAVLIQEFVSGAWVTVLKVTVDNTAADYVPQVEFNEGPQQGLRLNASGGASDAMVTFDTVETN